MRHLLFISLLCALTACGSGGHSSTAASPAPGASVGAVASSPASPLENPTALVLPVGASLLKVTDWSQDFKAVPKALVGTIDAPGTYTGKQVIAASGRDFAATDLWLKGLARHAPAGYTQVSTGSFAVSHMHDFGLDAVAFTNKQRKGLVVMAVDVRRLHGQLGLALGLLKDYKNLPQFMRGPLDKKVAAQTGVTPEEMLDTQTPLGSAIGAMESFERAGKSGTAIVIFTASKT